MPQIGGDQENSYAFEAVTSNVRRFGGITSLYGIKTTTYSLLLYVCRRTESSAGQPSSGEVKASQELLMEPKMLIQPWMNTAVLLCTAA